MQFSQAPVTVPDIDPSTKKGTGTFSPEIKGTGTFVVVVSGQKTEGFSNRIKGPRPLYFVKKGTGTFYLVNFDAENRQIKRPRPLFGFSLVELMVVIGIIAALIGIVLPAMTRVRESSKSVVCLSNLRQFAIAAANYNSNYRGSYPPAYWTTYSGTTTYSCCWDLTTITVPGASDRVVLGLLWDGSGNARVQQCPSFEGSADYNEDPYTGYNYNTSYIGHGQWESVPAPAKASQVRNSSRTALFGDGEYASGANKFMRAPFPNEGDSNFDFRWSGTQGYRHRGRTNVAFCDGHADSLLDRFTANANGAINVAPHTGFLSTDNSAYAVP